MDFFIVLMVCWYIVDGWVYFWDGFCECEVLCFLGKFWVLMFGVVFNLLFLVKVVFVVFGVDLFGVDGVMW